MTSSRIVKAAAAFGLMLAGYVLHAAAPETPIGAPWWPSPWEHRATSVARRTGSRPRKVQAASRLIRDGKVNIQLGRLYEYGMPLPGKRHFSLTIPGSPTGGPDGDNRIVYHDDLFSGEIGQIGTQLDGLGHVGVRVGRRRPVSITGSSGPDFGKTYGLEKLGIENVGVFFTRLRAHRRARPIAVWSG